MCVRKWTNHQAVSCFINFKMHFCTYQHIWNLDNLKSYFSGGSFMSGQQNIVLSVVEWFSPAGGKFPETTVLFPGIKRILPSCLRLDCWFWHVLEYSGRLTVLAGSRCYNKIPQTRWLIKKNTHTIYFSHFLRLEVWG